MLRRLEMKSALEDVIIEARNAIDALESLQINDLQKLKALLKACEGIHNAQRKVYNIAEIEIEAMVEG